MFKKNIKKIKNHGDLQKQREEDSIQRGGRQPKTFSLDDEEKKK